MGRLSKCTRPGNGTKAKGRGGGEVDGLNVEVRRQCFDEEGGGRRGLEWVGEGTIWGEGGGKRTGVSVAAEFHHNLHQIRRDGNWRTA